MPCRRRWTLPAAGLLLALFLTASGPAVVIAAEGPTLQPADVVWTTNAGLVRFNLRFRNLDPGLLTEPATGRVHAQDFGVFLPDLQILHEFVIPPIEPESFFDVFFEVPLCDLPGACGLPTGLPVVLPCPPEDHWDGNVDVFWNWPGGGAQVNVHTGAGQACPGAGRSCTHLVTGCAAPAPWVLAGLTAGWSATLVNEDFTPAANPVPPGWSGHLCVTAGPNVPFGAISCITLTFNCLGAPGVITLCTTACECPVPVLPHSWGSIKALYR